VDGSTSVQASEPEHTNPRESGPPNNEQATAKWLKDMNKEDGISTMNINPQVMKS